MAGGIGASDTDESGTEDEDDGRMMGVVALMEGAADDDGAADGAELGLEISRQPCQTRRTALALPQR